MNTIESGGNIAPALQSAVARIEQLNVEIKELTDDRREVFSEAREKGLNLKTLKEILRIRRLDEAERAEEELLRDVYLRAMGLLE